MNKNYYLVYTQNVAGNYFADEDDERELQLIASVLKVSESDNVASKLECISNLMHANIMPTKRKAEEVARYWNECYKKNGTYAYMTF